MKFYDKYTGWDMARNLVKGRYSSYSHFYSEWFRDFTAARSQMSEHAYKTGVKQFMTEEAWYDIGRPYYNIYPGITPILCKVKHEKIPCNLINFPYTPILFRFAEQDNLLEFGDGYKPQTILIESHPGELVLWIDFGEKEFDMPILTYKVLSLDRPTIEDAINVLDTHHSINFGLTIPQDIVLSCIRIVVATALLSTHSDDGLVEPDVLAADRDKFDKTNDQKFVDKAIRRGKKGFLVGRHIEMAPHYRSASPLALYWTGPGRTIPLYRWRSGCIVNRKVVDKLPTGYLDK